LFYQLNVHLMDIEFNKNEDALKTLCYQLKSKLKKVYLGGGEARIKVQHEKGKLTARERIQYLIDDNSEFLEVGAFAGDDMYKEHRLRERQALRTGSQRCDRKSRGLVPDYCQKELAGAGDCHGKPVVHYLSGR
jgi:acetyl-CoA carboxylase carboxyltransferase component